MKSLRWRTPQWHTDSNWWTQTGFYQIVHGLDGVKALHKTEIKNIVLLRSSRSLPSIVGCFSLWKLIEDWWQGLFPNIWWGMQLVSDRSPSKEWHMLQISAETSTNQPRYDLLITPKCLDVSSKNPKTLDFNDGDLKSRTTWRSFCTILCHL